MTGWLRTSALAAAALFVAWPAAAQLPVVVGAVVSETGSHAVAAAEYRKGLILWQEEVNRLGGLLGKPVELRLADDGSEAVRSGREYARLIAGGAQILIG